MTDSEIKAQQRMKHRLTHRAGQLRRMADELDALAAELDQLGDSPVKTDGQGAETDG